MGKSGSLFLESGDSFLSSKIGEHFSKKKLYYIWLLIAAALVGLDRFTKWLVTTNMELKETINLIKFGDTEILNIYYCLNTGAAFSKLDGHRWLLIAVTSVVLIGLLGLVIIGKIKRPIHIAAVGLVIGGGIGNLIDRVFNDGKVIDFIDVRLINFPIFNVADICAVVGAGLVILSVIIDEVREFKKKRSKVTEDGSGDGKA